MSFRSLGRSSLVFVVASIATFSSLTGAAFAAPSSLAGVLFDRLPADNQLYPRGADNTAEIAVRGSVVAGRYSDVRLRVVADGERLLERRAAIGSGLGRSEFAFSVDLPAGLVSYRFVVELFDGRDWRVAARSENVTVGDVYLVQGQSNAVATDYHFEGLANQNQRNWIRSFGSASTFPAIVENDLNWYVADGLGSNGSGTIGAWALKTARLLSELYQVPIAVLNGAVGGTAISYHLRDDAQPVDLETNYGRLLYRAEMSGVRQAARALIWYQGESDTNNIEPWARDFGELYDDWQMDFPGLERFYVFQIRNSCGFATDDMQNTQRRLPEFYPLVSVMSTTAAPGHDGCHFFFAGYDELGDRLARVMARDLHGSEITENIDPPAIDFASFSSPAQDEVTLVFEDPDDELFVDPGAEDDFYMSDGVDVVAAEVFGNTIVLTLAGPSNASEVEYRGHSFDGPWVTNARGVGALTFAVPIER